MDLARLRNIGIVAHIDAGKTTVTERILYYAGVEHRMGEVHEGTTVMDWMEEERRRGITITAAVTTVPWRDATINIVDTPGHVDFTVEVERCMRVLDGAVLVLNGVAGLQAQSETVWRQMKRHAVPFLVFVNQYDRAGADYFRCIAEVSERLGEPAIALQYPLGTEREFRGVVDLLTRQAWEFSAEDLGRRPVPVPIPEEVRDEVEVLRAELVEAIAEGDEAVLQHVVEERDPPLEELVRALRARVLARTLIPVLCGAALRNVGIQPLLDAVVDLLPSPLDVPAVTGRGLDGREVECPARADAPTCALAFKQAADAHEDLTFVRVYSGTLLPGARLLNPRTERVERVARVLQMHADERLALERAGPGAIVALTGLKEVATGDTLCEREQAVALEGLEFPEPVMTVVVEPVATSDRDRLRAALFRLAAEDPTLHVREDEETGQWLLAGMGELHLEVARHRLDQAFRVEVKVGTPRVAYRESVKGTGRGHGRVERVLAGKEVFGELEVELLPADELGAPAVEWEPSVAVPAAFRPAATEALRLGAMVGPRFGFPLVGARIRVVGGGSVPSKDSEQGFTQAAAQALRQAMADAEIELQEPVMAFEIEAPAEFMSGIIADLNGRRADIADVRVDADLRKVVGVVPLAQMFGYSTTVRSLSQGRAGVAMSPAGFRPVPASELEARGLVWT